MSEKKKVVLVGWNPEVVNCSKWPGLTPEKLRATLEGDRDNLYSLGYEAELLYINDANTAYDTVSNALKETTYDCVLIGAGVRTVDEHFLVFEKLVNAVHQNAPTANICFNTNPSDTAEAVKRWIHKAFQRTLCGKYSEALDNSNLAQSRHPNYQPQFLRTTQLRHSPLFDLCSIDY